MKNYLMTNKRNNGDLLNFVDDAFGGFFKPIFLSDSAENMLTDITDRKNDYLLEIEMPGFDKGDIKISVEDEYLIVEAKKEEKEDDKKDKSFIRKERSMTCSRSYFIGNAKTDGIKASYKDGVLSVIVPKEEADEKKQLIEIE